MTAAAVALATLAVTAALPAVAAAESLAVLELLRLDCGNRIGGREVTLFANGTVRLRLERDGLREMKLAELTPGELEAYRNRLREEDLSEAEPERTGVSGDWVERCRLELAAEGEGESRRVFWFSRFDSLSLTLSRVVGIADELAAEAERRAPLSRLPTGYEPRPGDVLLRADGASFEVVTFTGDGRGVELVGVDQPLTVFILKEALATEFVRLLERRRP